MRSALAQHLFGTAGAFLVHDLLRERHLLLLGCLTSAAIDLAVQRIEQGWVHRAQIDGKPHFLGNAVEDRAAMDLANVVDRSTLTRRNRDLVDALYRSCD